MTVIPTNDCKGPYLKLDQDAQIDHRTICAGGGVADTCGGDSGGPLLALKNESWALVGVTSYGVGCGSESFPGVYFSTAKYTRWIYNKIRAIDVIRGKQ